MQTTHLKPAVKLDGKYQTPVPTEVGGLSTMFKVLPQFLTNREERKPRIAPGPFRTDPSLYAHPPATGLRITWFGHSCMLLEQDGVTLLVDPVWEDRAAPLQWAGPKRFFPPTLPLAELPPLDAVLFSHDHYDHLGAHTARELAVLHPHLRFVCPLAVGTELQRFGVAAANITELDWTENTVLRAASGAELTVTAVPARHFSGRSLWNRNQTLWAAFALRSRRHNVFYGADTGLWSGFEAIAQQHGPFDLTMLEIGAFNELWSDIHMGPDGAVEAFRRLGGGVLMPIHWGLFDLALHSWRQPIQRVFQLAESEGLTLFSPEPGLPTDVLPAQDLRSRWWQQQG